MNNNLVYGVSALSEKPDLNVSTTLKLSVLHGRNRISRVSQTLNVFYGGTSVTSNSVNLDAAVKHPVTGIVTPALWTMSTPVTKPFKIITIYASRPLRVKVFTDNDSYHVDVKRLWVCDSPISKIEVMNMDHQEAAQFTIEILA